MNKPEFTEAFALAYLAARVDHVRPPLNAHDAERFIVLRDRAWCDYLALRDHPEWDR